MKKVKIKLAGILYERSMTQAELAHLSGVRPNAISNLCRGYVDRLSIDHIEKISNALDLESISDLIDFVDVDEEKA
ncbi:helix-turn-helix transcriptional regulator [Lysinibacillus irui]|uniref:Helix-turn-helix transcriptional regulator n=1 Tax=Lysinibacillus irui TaxID=2998077 RepID=A0ABU5NKB5_9BACI|nr:helix-turn-helix transcriptional regulator [Lysinibacillus irui]MEA0554767.1 helix-turn-helix transcriptional regulator [Lysinibacillus irui]MEA0976482.1 helix-turn-helix transcriptional regulator [Lysinibacillus irui]MEA1042636.1 helix-turn-helix transcriptional regulator [Lysinibacillus irui]